MSGAVLKCLSQFIVEAPVNLFRAFAFLTVTLAPAVIPSFGAGTAALSLVGSSTKVCQLTGETDWATNQPTAARTLSGFGMDAVDLGFPVDSGVGPLYLLFGDAWPIQHPPGSFPSVPPDDAFGWTTRTALPDDTNCLNLRLATSARRTFAHPTVLPAIKQGLFNVPSGGVFLDNTLYAFFWTDHCAKPAALAPETEAPLRLPPRTSTCLETAEINSVGRSVLARATPENPIEFHHTTPVKPLLFLGHVPAQMPSGFVYVTAATPAPDRAAILLPKRPEIPVIGVARYRASVPYLAMAPRATFGDPATWSFFAGRVAGNPVWVTRKEWESGRNAEGEWVPPEGAEIYTPVTTEERCVGEHSLTWNTPLHSWLLLYGCGGRGIEARTAPEPWGPWSAPTVLLSTTHDPIVFCKLIMGPLGCPGLVRRNYWPLRPDGSAVTGGFYGPFVLNRFTRGSRPQRAAQAKQATIYWLVSTWNPYQVVVMQSTLKLTD